MQYIHSFINNFFYIFLFPFNLLLSVIFRNKYIPNSVLHISYMVHVPYYTVQRLKAKGIKADYLAIGKSFVWDKSDYNFIRKSFWHLNILREFFFFWKIVSRYEIIHSHFMVLLSYTGWELFFLKMMKRKLIFHYRGCDVRDHQLILKKYPKHNICTPCDYNKSMCTGPKVSKRRDLANHYSDLDLVTTPDLLDFKPKAKFIPLSFFPESLNSNINKSSLTEISSPSRLRIVHATAQPGYEGSVEIQKIINRLISDGYDLDYKFITHVSHENFLAAYSNADLTIGKMKMGYYANSQLESLNLGIPCISYVREDLITEEILKSGIIISSLENLYETLKYYLDNPTEIEKKRNLARAQKNTFHNANHSIDMMLAQYKILLNNK